MMKLEKTITSLEVAEVTGKLHKNVIKDIRTIIEHLGAVNDSHGSNLSRDISSYFIEDEYLNSRNQKQTMYRLTKKGAELFSTRMTGAKGTQFAAFYVERFNDMETHIKEERPLSELSYEELQLAINDNFDKRLKHVEHELKNMQDELNKIGLAVDDVETYTPREAYSKALGTKISNVQTSKYTELLQSDGVLYKNNKNELRKDYKELGLARKGQYGKLRWTKKGIEFLAKRLPVLAYDNLHEAKQLTLL